MKGGSTQQPGRGSPTRYVVLGSTSLVLTVGFAYALGATFGGSAVKPEFLEVAPTEDMPTADHAGAAADNRRSAEIALETKNAEVLEAVGQNLTKSLEELDLSGEAEETVAVVGARLLELRRRAAEHHRKAAGLATNRADPPRDGTTEPQ